MKKPLTSLPTFSRRKTLEKEKESKQQDVAASTTENEETTALIDIDGVKWWLLSLNIFDISKFNIFGVILSI